MKTSILVMQKATRMLIWQPCSIDDTSVGNVICRLANDKIRYASRVQAVACER